ncbi:1-(5-phosphoribosyl)-5-[(5-phosphoribosylamino)methylideneamino]imidazole-4-carboxamide isomerase [Candidatus Aerophobetes bacterium]|nr:1-(5-phosphoribosyl)-5-[(5-phosphoribosylamino)methylideneamino]imidazole-4-carboxamide isomerase [Candidatus Aerophobetes bacterium]
MQIIPAIDIKEGKCVRLREGKLQDMEIFSEEPVVIARRWADKGAKILHVVDLDGAFYGKLTNILLIKKIIKEVKLPVQVGGGIRSYKEVKNLLNFGVARVVLGTLLWEDRDLAKRLFNEFSCRIIAGIDARQGFVAVQGWQNITQIEAIEFVLEMERLGAQRVIYTDIQRDGTLTGPNIAVIEKTLKKVNIPLIVSGGIASLNDIKELKKFEKLGLEGVILGKALYKENILLEEAIKIARN